MSSETIAELEAQVQEWLSIDQVGANVLVMSRCQTADVKNPDTRREISDLWAARHIGELKKRLWYAIYPVYSVILRELCPSGLA
jgi:hypothetical protein